VQPQGEAGAFDRTTRHHEVDRFQLRHILRRITVDGDQVRRFLQDLGPANRVRFQTIASRAVLAAAVNRACTCARKATVLAWMAARNTIARAAASRSWGASSQRASAQRADSSQRNVAHNCSLLIMTRPAVAEGTT
jgi:hypothetical protein